MLIFPLRAAVVPYFGHIYFSIFNIFTQPIYVNIMY